MIDRLRAELLLLVLLAAPSVSGQDRMWIPDLTVREGTRDLDLFLHAAHGFELGGFSISIRHDPAKLRIQEDASLPGGRAVTWRGTSVETLPEPIGFWNGKVSGDEVFYGAVFDLTSPLINFLPPSADRTLVRLRVDVLAGPGETTRLELEDGLGDATPITNSLADRSGALRRVVIAGGAIRVAIPPLAEAGPPLTVVEEGTVALDGSASGSPEGEAFQLAWVQVQGPPAVPLGPLDVARPRFSLPEVSGDQDLVFELTVTDPHGSSTDRVTVTVLDADLRQAQVALAEEPAREIDGGERALLFTGELSWETPVEDGLWTRVRFTPRGDADDSEALGAVSLYLDGNGNGELDAEDPRLGEPQALDDDDGGLVFSFSRRLAPGERRRFFLVGELEGGEDSRAASILPGALVLMALAGLGARRRIARGVLRSRGTVLFLVLLIPLALLSACGGGGGGGGGGAGGSGAPDASEEIRFDIRRQKDIALEGAVSGIPVRVRGLPLRGPTLEIRD